MIRAIVYSAILLVAVAWSAIVQAQVLTTAPDNNGSGGVFLDLAPSGPALIVTAFDLPFQAQAGTLVSVEVWTRPDSYVGNTGSSEGWTLTQTVEAESPGPGEGAAPLPLTTPILLPEGATTGIHLHAVAPQGTGQGIRYTGTTTIPPQTEWSNADLTLISHVAVTGSVPFLGNQFSPRTFSGTVHYAEAPTSGILTTAPPNNGSGGVFLELTPNGPALAVTAFEIPLQPPAGTMVSVEVWTRPGSYVGTTGSSEGWTLTQTIEAESPGADEGTAPLPLTAPIVLPEGATTGIYLHAVAPQGTGQGIRYTGTTTIPPQTQWANADLALFSDVAATGSVSFSGNQFSPRTFSGSVLYSWHDVIFANGFEPTD